MIIVDALVTYRGLGRLSGQWCHMVDDHADIEALHAFARRLGLRRSWFQNGRNGLIPHYDLRPSKRALALKLGAREVDRREMAEIVMDLRARSRR